MRQTMTLAAAAAAATLAAGTAAAEPSYDHVGLGVGLIELDERDRDGEGLVLDGKFSIGPNAYLLGRYAAWDLDAGVDREDFRLGGGLHGPISRNFDLIGELFYENRELERGASERDDDGFGLRGGVLGTISPGVTLGGGAVYYDLDSDEELGLYGETWVDVGRRVQVGGELELGDEQELLTVGARLRF
ncbi:hypothetical protein [Sediminicurvatus halobius]|uniref:Outer membrane protein beta-barrel domain-containing protein n=1 Tax=Sediminicurvatus halobius TaxID=2182432 RepID=A0A2U2MWS4_9GAMM|nr:hypothetical protein [Spiribacter halobius]PWG61256.1 hypothetical protein DEM34_17445 [Spiribacter halobius]UEX78445.1 hypothetical protein LMH63_02045 [Spiribacter halobius]